MPTLEVTNRTYQDRLQAEVFKAIMSVSMAEDGRTCALLSGEIVQACINIIAMMGGTSKATDAPRGARLFAEECGATIRRRIAAVREQHAAGALDFMQVIDADGRH